MRKAPAIDQHTRKATRDTINLAVEHAIKNKPFLSQDQYEQFMERYAPSNEQEKRKFAMNIAKDLPECKTSEDLITATEQIRSYLHDGSYIDENQIIRHMRTLKTA